MPPDGGFKLFQNHREAEYRERPNRFLIRAWDRASGEFLDCHCPNPGSMAELLLPGAPLILERRDGPGRTAWTAVGARYRGGVVPLYSARANDAARTLVLPRIFPEASGLRSEFRLGDSRFDFYFEAPPGHPHLVEVKSCSLVEFGIAMFPDAPSQRAVRHILELAALSRKGWTCHVLFVIVHGAPRVFIPNLHTDPAFAAALGAGAPNLDIRAVSLEVLEDGETRLLSTDIPIDLRTADLAAADRGSYLMVLEIPALVEVIVGSLGLTAFHAGWYVYVGSAQRGLSRRISRHKRGVGKRLHWHLDYLVPHARSIRGCPIASYDNLECELAADLGRIGGRLIPGFGSSDCGCPGHLYGFSSDPFKDRSFLDLLFRYRHVRALSAFSAGREPCRQG